MYYDRFLKALLEPTYRGQYLILDVPTGEYTVAPDYAPALVEQQKKHDGRLQYVTRIGERALMRRIRAVGLVAERGGGHPLGTAP